MNETPVFYFKPYAPYTIALIAVINDHDNVTFFSTLTGRRATTRVWQEDVLEIPRSVASWFGEFIPMWPNAGGDYIAGLEPVAGRKDL